MSSSSENSGSASSECSSDSFLFLGSSGIVTPTIENFVKSHRIEKKPSDKTRRLPKLRKYLQGISDARENPYPNATAFIVSWSDNLEAEDDLRAMENLMCTFSIMHDRHALDVSEYRPDWLLMDEFRDSVRLYQRGGGRSLVVFCYVGRAETINGEFTLMSESGDQKVPWSTIKEYLFDDDMCMGNIDILGILDCCYTEVATRAKCPRNAQIIAASGIKAKGINEQVDISFSKRLYQLAKKLAEQSVRSITTADLYQELRYDIAEQNSKKNDCDDQTYPIPVMEPPVGVEPIKLIFPVPHPTPPKPEEEIVVKMTLKGDNNGIRLLKSAVRDVSEKLDLKITHAFQTSK